MSQRGAGIIERIEAEILAGKLPPGERLPSEEKLCERFGASRTMIREAIQQLRGRGLLRTTKGSGTYICDPSLQSLTTAMEAYSALVGNAGFLELIDFRITIETECARLAAVCAGEGVLDDLRNIVKTMEAAKGTPTDFSSADIAFHLVIARGSGNRIYAGVLGAMERRCIDYAQFNRGDLDWYSGVIDAHHEILAAIAAGRSDQAAEAMRRHLISSKRHFVDLQA